MWLHVKQARRTHAQVNEDMFLLQKPSVRVRDDGDRNTKFIHAVVAERRSRSVVQRIKSNSRECLGREEDMSKEAITSGT